MASPAHLAEARLTEVRLVSFIPGFYASLEQSKVLGIRHLNIDDQAAGGYLQNIADPPCCPRLQDRRGVQGHLPALGSPSDKHRCRP